MIKDIFAIEMRRKTRTRGLNSRDMPQFEVVKDREMPEKALLNRYTQRDLVKAMQRENAQHTMLRVQRYTRRIM
jgi:hypothetical protein